MTLDVLELFAHHELTAPHRVNDMTDLINDITGRWVAAHRKGTITAQGLRNWERKLVGMVEDNPSAKNVRNLNAVRAAIKQLGL